MKNYIITILLVLGLGLLTSPLVADAKADVAPEVAEEITTEAAFETKTEISKIDVAKVADTANISAPVKATRTTTKTTTAKTTPRASYDYTVTKTTGALVKKPTYSDIYRTGKLVYAHNSSNLFGNLKNLGIGSTFTLTENGVTTTYKVSGVEYYKKIAVNGGEDLAKCSGLSDNCSGRWMNSLVKNAGYHNVALMTCAGQSYGNGDASHRLIILADKA